MQFEERQERGVLIAKPLERRLDAAVIQEFKEHMAGKVHEGHQRIALNMGDVEFMDSSGLAGIISVLRYVGDSGGIVIFGAGFNVLTLLKLTRMDRVIPVLDGVEDALQELEF